MTDILVDRKRFHIAAFIGVLAVGGLGSLGYMRHTEANQRKQDFENIFQEINKNLPPNFQQTHSEQENFFSTEGTYKISYKNPKDSKYNSEYIMDYKVHHGISYFFTGQLDVEAVSKISGFLGTKLTSSNNFMKTTGVVKSNGDSQFTSQGSETVIGDDKSKVVIKPFTMNNSYTVSSGDMKTELNIPSLELKSANKSGIVNNITMKRNSNTANLNIGSFILDVASISMENVHSKGFSITSNVTLENKMYNDKGGIHIREINADNKKVLSNADFDYSLKGLDASSIDYFINVYKKADDIQEKDIKDAKSNMLKMLQKGFIVSIDQFKVEADFGKIDMNALWQIKPTQEKFFSLANQLKFVINTKVEGNLATMAKMQYEAKIKNTENIDISAPVKEWKMEISYENGQGKIGDVPIPEEQLNAFKLVSDKLQEELTPGSVIKTEKVEQIQVVQ